MTKRLVFLLAIVLPVFIFGQEKPVYEKKMYVSPEGKLYVNKDLPLYVWLSSSPDESSEKHLLKSEETSKYSNPMYLDVDGYNTFRSPSAVDTITHKTAYPIQDIVFEVYADISPPLTKRDFGEVKPYIYQGKTYIRKGAQLSLSASDKLSGVESIYYSINGTNYAKYSQALTFSEEKDYIIKYYAVDNVGNDEDVTEFTIVYDISSPKTAKKTIGDEHENILSARSKIELVTEDQGIGIKNIVYQIDEGKEFNYTYPLKASTLSQGEHKLTFYAVDKVGNKENPQEYNFYVDKTPPTIIEEVIAKTFFANGKEYASGKAQLKLTSFDNKAGVKEIKYSINGGEYLAYEKPVFLTQSAGNLNIKTFAIDNVNNKSVSQTANQKTSIPYIDLSGPNLNFSLHGPVFKTRDSLFITKGTKIKLFAKDLEAGVNRIEYTINGENNKEFTEPFSIEQEGVYKIDYVGYDQVENTSSASLTVVVDNTGPEINYQYSIKPIGKSNGLNTYPKYVILFLSGTDSVVGLESISYGFGETTTKIYTIPISGFSVGDKSIILKSKDKLGNTTTENLKLNITE